MKRALLVITLQAFVLIGWSQDSSRIKQIHYSNPQDVCSSVECRKATIADETKITDLKATVKIETENELIYNKLVKEMGNALKYVTIRHDKPMWVLYFRKDSRPQVMAWFRKLNGD